MKNNSTPMTAGCDLGDKYSFVVVINEDGEVAERFRLRTTPTHFERLSGSTRLCLWRPKRWRCTAPGATGTPAGTGTPSKWCGKSWGTLASGRRPLSHFASFSRTNASVFLRVIRRSRQP